MKKNLHLISLISIALNLFIFLPTTAQNIDWAKQGSGTDTNTANAITFDQEGNSYVVGQNYSDANYGNINLAAGGMLIKYSPEGEVIWAKSIQNYHGIVYGVSTDNDDNVYIVGNFYGQLILGESTITSRGSYDAYIAKFDKDGSLIWLQTIGGTGEDAGFAISIDKLQNVFITGSVSGPAFFGNTQVEGLPIFNLNNAFIAKFNADGSFNYAERIPGPSRGADIELDKEGNIYMVGSYTGVLNLAPYGLPETNPNSYSGLLLIKFSKEWQFQWIKLSKPTPPFDLISNNNPGYVYAKGLALDKIGNCYVQGDYTGTMTLDNFPPLTNGFINPFTAKFSATTGESIWLKQNGIRNHYNRNTIAVDSTGNIFLGGRVWEDSLEGKFLNYGNNDFIVAKYNTLGRLSWVQGITTEGLEATVRSIALSKDGRVGVTGDLGGSYNIPSLNQSGRPLVSLVLTMVLADSTTGFIPNRISGNIYHDTNGNCQKDNSDKGLGEVLVKAEPGSFFALTDNQGNFVMEVDKGSYSVSPVTTKTKTNKILESCKSSEVRKVNFNKYNQKANNINFGFQLKECTQLTIDIAADRRRRCFRSQTTVTFANEGAADAQNVQVKVIYPKYVVPISSTLPWTSQKDSLLVFTIGQLKAGEKRSFIITDSTICGNENIRGLSQCVKALITPKSTCVTPNANWNQASVAVMGTYQEETESATFVVENTGEGAMTDSTNYRIYANEALIEEGKTKLDKGDKLTLEIPMKSQALRVEADQVKDHPGNSRPNATVQPMMAMPDVPPPTPEDAFYQDDADADVEISCLPIIDSYDPNDKQVSPIGITKRHYIKATDELEYLIRFQNTGTDVAYKVVVVDTLSEKLDIASLRVGAASHPFTYTVSGKGQPVLTFTFNNINLPDHKTNEPASHGFIKFTIAQTSDNPKGTRITNAAYNYFDYNAPVKTNEVFNIVGDTIIQAVAKTAVYDCGKEKPTPAQTVKTINLCDTDYTLLTGNQPEKGKGRWRLISGQATLVNPDNYLTEIKNIGYGEVIVEWTIQLCEQISRSQIRINRFPVPAPPIVNELSLQCELSPQALTAIGQSITWYADAAKAKKLHTGNTYQPATILANTVYYVTQTRNGCESAVKAIVVPVQSSQISFTVQGDTLIAPWAEQYQWFFNNEPLKAGNMQKIRARNSGLYRVEILNQNCSATSGEQNHQVQLIQNQLLVKPNPIDQQLNLELTTHSTGAGLIRIWNQLGIKVKEEAVQKPTTLLEKQIQLNNLAAGVYFVEVQIGKDIVRQKFVKN